MAVAVTMKWFSRASQGSIGGEAWTAATMKVALLDTVPDQDTAEFWDDVSATEVTGTNWSAGGVTLAGKAVTFDAGTNTTTLDANDVSVASVDVSGVEPMTAVIPNSLWGGKTDQSAIVIYDDTGTPATSRLWAFGDLAETGVNQGGTLTIPWDTDGILTLAAS